MSTKFFPYHNFIGGKSVKKKIKKKERAAKFCCRGGGKRVYWGLPWTTFQPSRLVQQILSEGRLTHETLSHSTSE